MNSRDDSWFWPVLDEYRDAAGRTFEEVANDWISRSDFFATERERAKAIATKRWLKAPRSEKAVEQIIDLLADFFPPQHAFTYLEFGTCFGTTLARVLSAFPNAQGIGVEVDLAGFEITRWLIERMDPQWNLKSRVTLYNASILNVPLPPTSVDVVFMDTDHSYDEDLRIIRHLISGGVLGAKFLFVADDPFHTGTHRARERFAAEEGSRYDIVTSAPKNLWWFVERRPRSAPRANLK